MTISDIMEVINPLDLKTAIDNVLVNVVGIDELYPVQIQLLSALVHKDNIFFTSSTNSGKTLPCVLYPLVLDELNRMGYNVMSGKVLFVTALNSIKLSMSNSMKALGIDSEAVSVQNISEVLKSPTQVLFISPETMKVPEVTKCMLMHRKEFILKVIDEAHLGKFFRNIYCINLLN